MLESIAGQPGTYLLVFHTDRRSSVRVGKLGELALIPGYYFYIGSAFGPGGLRARVRHHAGIATKPHWHLDYIRPAMRLVQIWYSTDLYRYEHEWADSLYYTMQMMVPLAGLGASDCACSSHFFYTEGMPVTSKLKNALTKNKNNINLTVVKYNEKSLE